MPEDPSLFYWIDLLRRRWRFVAITGALAGVLTLGLVLLQPLWYQGHARLLPPHEAQAPLLSTAGMEAAIRLESLLPFAAGVTLSDIYLGILDSDTVARTLIDRFDLQSVYEKSTLAKTLKELRARTHLAPDLNGILVIRVEDKDPQRAADLANAYVEELDRIFRTSRSTTARLQREFLESRVAESQAEINGLHERLVESQEAGQVTALAGDLTEAAEAAGTLLGRRLALTVRLRMMAQMGVADSPYRRELESELTALEGEISRLPHIGLDVGRLLRDIRIQEFLHFTLSEQLETARLEEVRDTRRVEVLDTAIAPDRHVRPRRGLVTVAGGMLGLALGFLWVAYRERQE